MENKKYNILWIDDEYHKLDALIRSAKDFGIKLIPYKSLDGGMSELEKNYPYYDGVLLDAKFFENENDEAGSEDTYSSFRAKERIEQLPKKFEIFILTGQAEAFDGKTFNKVFANVFRKGIDEDEDALFEALINSADNQIDTQICHENPKLFSALENYDLEATKTILKILTSIKNGGNDFDDKEQFTQLRIILELIFRKANESGLLHDNCVKGKVNLTDSSLFLAGEDTRHSGVRCVKTHFPKIIANAVKHILYIAGGASHTTEVDPVEEVNIQKYRDELKTPYLLFSLTFQLIDVIIWFDGYLKANNNYQTNVCLWETIEQPLVPTQQGIGNTIQQDENGNYYCGDAVFQYHRIHERYNVGTKVEIFKTVDNTSSTKDIYPKFIVGFKTI